MLLFICVHGVVNDFVYTEKIFYYCDKSPALKHKKKQNKTLPYEDHFPFLLLDIDQMKGKHRSQISSCDLITSKHSTATFPGGELVHLRVELTQ